MLCLVLHMTSSTFFFPELPVSSSYKTLSLQHLCVQTQEYKLWPDNPETVSSLGGNCFLPLFRAWKQENFKFYCIFQW